LNVTVPLADVDDTVAVKVTDEPNAEGFEDDETVVRVFALLIVWVSADDVLLLQFESPAYEPVIECDPAARAEVLNVALPLLSVPLPTVALPSLNVTVPVQVDGLSVAVNLTEEP
jgi:hypothetical protein